MLTPLMMLLGLLAFWQAPAPAATPSAAAPTPSALSSEPKGWIDLLADSSLAKWSRVPLTPVGQLPAGDVSKPSPWTFDAARGVLVCEGDKASHEMFRYAQEAGDFVYHAEWRYAGPPDQKAYNSGILVRANADGTIWHQAQTGAGGGYLFGATLVDGKPGRVNVRDKMIENRVKPAGEWNVYEIRATGKTMTLWVNGAVVSEMPNVEVPRGFVGLEAEGYLVEFRNLKLKILDPAR
jgi:hypothetical protein